MKSNLRNPIHPAPRLNRRAGLSLIEVLIAMTMTLIVLYAMMWAFQFASREMSKGRATIEMSNQLRAAESLLRRDLDRLTIDPRPWMQTATPNGYFEYIDGQGVDNSSRTPDSATVSSEEYIGDIDDVLCMTVRSDDLPFRGRYNGGIVESSVAEIIWFTVHNDRDGDGVLDFDESLDLCRRVLLIRPDLATDANWAAVSAGANFASTNDISHRNEGGSILPNSLLDLAKRENRFAHDSSAFPHMLASTGIGSLADTRTGSVSGGSLVLNGEDIILTNVAAFDIRVYSPNANMVSVGSSFGVGPSDTNYAAATGTDQTVGAFVDLGYTDTRVTGGKFSGTADAKSGFTATQFVFCTWSPHYEYDNVNQNGGDTDPGTNGTDDDGDGIVDDFTERETMPPYPDAIRGLKVTFRLAEKDTKQIRQSSVIHSFVPE